MTFKVSSSRHDLFSAMTVAAGNDKEALRVIRYFRRHAVDVPLIESPNEAPMLAERTFDQQRAAYVTQEGQRATGYEPEDNEADGDTEDCMSWKNLSQYLIAHSSTYPEYIQNRLEETDGSMRIWHDFPTPWNSQMIGVSGVQPKWDEEHGTDNSLVVCKYVTDDSSPARKESRIMYYTQTAVSPFFLGIDLLRSAYSARAMPSPISLEKTPEIYIGARKMASRLIDRAMNGLFLVIARSIHDHSIPASDPDPQVVSRKRVQQAEELILEKMIDYFGEAGTPLEDWVRKEYAHWEILTSHMTYDTLMALTVLNYGIDGTYD